jgi:NAD-dependent SIR2 family protein deacetylase
VTVTGLQLLKTHLDQCQDLAVLTGAGISAESGVPTFRGQDGLWGQYRAVDLATPQAFQRDPGLVQPTASMGAWAKQHCAFVAELNLETTPQSGIYDLALQGRAGELLPQLLE